MNTIRIATRASQLALVQARWVGAALQASHPGLGVELVEVTTTGDLDRTSPVATLTEVGAFVRSVQQAVLDGRADLAVHSCKDMPVHGPDGLRLLFPLRATPWDVMCGSTVAALTAGARVGTGSPRRSAQLALLRPDIVIDEIRGNVDTRLAKVTSGEYDAIVLAEAGLIRIGRTDAIAQHLSVEDMVPAPAQGALAVEVPEGGPAEAIAALLDHAATRRAVETERLVLERTGAGCRSALGVYAEAGDTTIRVHGFAADHHGSRSARAEGPDPEGAATAVIRGLSL
ncbi:MAG: hydroxymethylbilane synthase [Acidimicrobiia bacterium]